MHLLPEKQLIRFGAHSLFDEEEPGSATTRLDHENGIKPENHDDEGKNVKVIAASTVSGQGSSTCIERSRIGIGIAGWNITSISKSPIASDIESEALSTKLQDLACRRDSSLNVFNISLDGEEPTEEISVGIGRSKRLLLHPPEILFVKAYLKLEFGRSESDEKRYEIKFSPKDAIFSWAIAHQYLKSKNTSNNIEESKKSDRLISLLQTVDAKIWSEKAQYVAPKQVAEELQFDWTFSTPYLGSNTSTLVWEENKESGIEKHMRMLLDRSEPILMYEDVRLFEDDLHDNGHVQLTVKIRVMPKCFYVLMRFFLRVDHVLVRCRDVRFFHIFGKEAIYRDVVWREIRWKNMKAHNLPSEITAWRVNMCNDKLENIPKVPLPHGLCKFSSSRIK